MPYIEKSSDEIFDLLETLMPVRTIQGPSLETQLHVPERLIEIANETAESRTQVIDALIKIIKSQKKKKNRYMAHKWLTAIDVLGKLRATEAIDILVKIIDETYRSPMIIDGLQPAVIALARIGEPAIPQLTKALSDKKASVRKSAAYTLGIIDGKNAEKVLRKALVKEKNKEVKRIIKKAFPKEGPRITRPLYEEVQRNRKG